MKTYDLLPLILKDIRSDINLADRENETGDYHQVERYLNNARITINVIIEKILNSPKNDELKWVHFPTSVVFSLRDTNDFIFFILDDHLKEICWIDANDEEKALNTNAFKQWAEKNKKKLKMNSKKCRRNDESL